MEWDQAVFSCVRGSNFTNESQPLLVNGSFPLQCGLLGKYPDPITWANCFIAFCLTLPTPAGYKTNWTAPIAVNASINYTCATTGKWSFIYDVTKLLILILSQAWAKVRPTRLTIQSCQVQKNLKGLIWP